MKRKCIGLLGVLCLLFLLSGCKNDSSSSSAGGAQCATAYPCLFGSVGLTTGFASPSQLAMGSVSVVPGGGSGSVVGATALLVDEYRSNFLNPDTFATFSGAALQISGILGAGLHPGTYVYEVVLRNSAGLAAWFGYDPSRSTTHYVLYALNVNTQTLDSVTVSPIPLAKVVGNPGAGTDYYLETFSNSGASADTMIRYHGTNTVFQGTSGDDTSLSPENFYGRMLINLNSGTHYFRVSDEYTTGGAYSIRISQSGFGGTSSANPAVPDAYEPDDSSGGATALTLDVVQDHSFTVGEDDWFSIVVP